MAHKYCISSRVLMMSLADADDVTYKYGISLCVLRILMRSPHSLLKVVILLSKMKISVTHKEILTAIRPVLFIISKSCCKFTLANISRITSGPFPAVTS